jgi:phage major head subunit gpT-like protein
MFSITRKDIINDDLGAFNQIRTKLGRGGALGLNRDFWTVFMNNSAFFTSGRNNLASGAGTVLSLTSLDQAQALFLNQTDPDGDPVAIAPSILLVPNALKVAASNFMNSTTVVNNTTANTTTLGNNPFAGLFRVLSSSYLSNSTFTGNSTTAWYLLANPSDVAVIEVAFLNGKEMPTVESADADFNVLGIQFRGYFDYGVANQEYRGGVKMAGA